MQLSQRICLVTGASGGIGQALCRALAAQGARLVLSGRRDSALQGLADALPRDSVLGVLSADQSDAQAIAALGQQAAELGVNTLINLAGVNELALYEDMTPSALAAMIQLNLTAPMLLTHALLPQLRSVPEAMIVNIGSAFGSIGFPGYVGYCAGKFGLRGFSEALRRELHGSAVSVIYVAPRATATAMNEARAEALNTALGNQTDSADWVAQQILASMQKRTHSAFLGWPEKLFVRLNGLLPRLVDRSLAKQLPIVREHARRS